MVTENNEEKNYEPKRRRIKRGVSKTTKSLSFLADKYNCGKIKLTKKSRLINFSADSIRQPTPQKLRFLGGIWLFFPFELLLKQKSHINTHFLCYYWS